MRRLLIHAAAAAALLLPLAPVAHADPPEGCVGFPSIPQLFVCITQWTPENAVPTVTPGPGQTIVIPEFCVFQCFGPTPVTVPSVVITQGSGVVAVVQYNGQTYTVAVPPIPDPTALVNQVVAQVTALVQQVVDTVNGLTENDHGSVDMAGTANVACYGCGDSSGTMSGTYAATVDGVPHSGSYNASFATHEGTGTDCVFSGAANGSIFFSGWGSTSFSWSRTASLVTMSFTTPEGYHATVYATWQVSTVGFPCGTTNLQATFSGTGRIDD